jgi:hypothetical protein
MQNYKGPLNTLAMTNSDLVKQEDIKVMFSNIHLILPLNQVRILLTRLCTTAVYYLFI